jgi:hypothetical protein
MKSQVPAHRILTANAPQRTDNTLIHAPGGPAIRTTVPQVDPGSPGAGQRSHKGGPGHPKITQMVRILTMWTIVDQPGKAEGRTKVGPGTPGSIRW